MSRPTHPDPVLTAAQAAVGEPCVCGHPTASVVGYRSTRGVWSHAIPTCGTTECMAYASFGGPGGQFAQGKPRWFRRQLVPGKRSVAVREAL